MVRVVGVDMYYQIGFSDEPMAVGPTRTVFCLSMVHLVRVTVYPQPLPCLRPRTQSSYQYGNLEN